MEKYKFESDFDRKDEQRRPSLRLFSSKSKESNVQGNSAFSSLLSKKKQKPERKKKNWDIKKQSKLPTSKSDVNGKQPRRASSVDSSPTSPPKWLIGRKKGGSCPGSPTYAGSGSKGPPKVMSRSQIEGTYYNVHSWSNVMTSPPPSQNASDDQYGPLVKTRMSPSSQKRKNAGSPEEMGQADIHLHPGGIPEVHKIQLKVKPVVPQVSATLEGKPVQRKLPKDAGPRKNEGIHPVSQVVSNPVPKQMVSSAPVQGQPKREKACIPGSPQPTPQQYAATSSYSKHNVPPPKPQRSNSANSSPALPKRMFNPQQSTSNNQPKRSNTYTDPRTRHYVNLNYGYTQGTPYDVVQKNPSQAVNKENPTENLYDEVYATRSEFSLKVFPNRPASAQGRDFCTSPRHQQIGSQGHPTLAEPSYGYVHVLSSSSNRNGSVSTPGSSPEMQRISHQHASPQIRRIIESPANSARPNRNGNTTEEKKGGYSSEPENYYDIEYNSVYSESSRSKSLEKPSRDPLRNGGRRIPRRHTVGGDNLMQEQGQAPFESDPDRKKEVFLDALAKRYPRYADKISGSASEDGFPIATNRRPRDPQRRATVVTYNPDGYDDVETMSNIEGHVSRFTRGGFMRSSMPIVRSPPNIYEKLPGCVFLIYREETRRFTLPNEITHLDTVRAMFVQAFPEKLTLDYLDNPRRKIYILEPKSSIYYQLEDLRDIKDRTVLKIHECESNEAQKVREMPPEVRGRVVQSVRDMTPPRVPVYGNDLSASAMSDQVRKAHTLPATMSHSYPPFAEQEYERQRSQTPEPAKPPRGQSSQYGSRSSYQSPDRGHAERLNLKPIPENKQMQNGYSNQLYDTVDGAKQKHPIQGHHSHPVSHHRAMSPPGTRTHPGPSDLSRRAFSPPPRPSDYDVLQAPGGPAPGAPPASYVAHGVRASTVVSPLRATGPHESRQAALHPNRHSLAFTPMAVPDPSSTGQVNGVQRSQSYRVTPESEKPPVGVPQRPRSVTPQTVPPDSDKYGDWVRMDKMEAQIASLAAWVQSAVSNTSSRASSIQSGASTTPSEPGGSHIGSVPGKGEGLYDYDAKQTQGMSDLSSASQHTITSDIKESIRVIHRKATELKTDLRHIRRMHQLNTENMQESMGKTCNTILNVLKNVPGSEHSVLRQQRVSVEDKLKAYADNKEQALKELHDLEASVEEVRHDVLSRHCLVNMGDIEGMALLLSTVAKCLGDLKSHFPTLQGELKSVMAGEMEVVVKEEKFLKDEPETLEEGLKRCKKLTNTLFTLKRLASVQEHRPKPSAAQQLGGIIPSNDDRKALLENIQSLVPNHEARVEQLKAADLARERKKKIVIKQEALKFGKSLEIATKNLKPSGSRENIDTLSSDAVSDPSKSTKPTSEKPMDANVLSSQQKPKESSDTMIKRVKLQELDKKPMASSVQSHAIPKSKVSRQSQVKSQSDESPEQEPQEQKVQQGSKGDKHVSDVGATKVGSTSAGSAEDAKRAAAILRQQKSSARAHFFSSLTTPPTSPPEEKKSFTSPTATTMDYTVRMSPVRNTTTGEIHYTVTNSVCVTAQNKPSASASSSSSSSHSVKPTSLPMSVKKGTSEHKNVSSSSSSSSSPSPTTPSYAGAKSSNIPRVTSQRTSSSVSSVDHLKTSKIQHSTDDRAKLQISESVPKSKPAESGEVDVKQKRPPPPPPPRKSSRPPSHPGSVHSESFMESSKQSSSYQDLESSVVTGHHLGLGIPSGTLTSTPKAAGPLKLSTKFEKDLVMNTAKTDFPVSGSTKDPKSLGQKAEPKTESSQPPREERESSSESTTSSSSLDSQQGVVVLRCKPSSSGEFEGNKPTKKPKPPPPARRSSLSSGNKSFDKPNGCSKDRTDDQS